ncbi:hypothetical protein [Flavobacterium selenitireducens]|uniref:hypothetical protein n=1 Tax=Flavobacterium selenitireducens TaxID=2722704 RepID=UPI00168A9B11|nr:hypothetical protein [Flavobacterium selenitireducens]MBD3583710.1 hypothetical protein [Flavobacterium selenitireducens]
MDLRSEIHNSTAHRPIRDRISGYVLEHHEELETLLGMCLDVSDEDHHKACWNLELVLESRIDWLQPHLKKFCDSLVDFTDDSALRSISKICLFISQREFTSRGNGNFATDEQLRKIASATFDWLIDERKVATKAYAMRALYLLGKRYDWIYPELKEILSKDFPHHSAGYKAAAKQLLRRL